MRNKVIDLISNIMTKRHGVFTGNFTILFSNAGRTENVPQFEFDIFYKTIFFRWYKCNIYIVTTSALDFKQLYIIYKFYLIKRVFLPERIPYLAQTFNCSSQT